MGDPAPTAEGAGNALKGAVGDPAPAGDGAGDGSVSGVGGAALSVGFVEHLRAPGYVFGALGLLLGVDSGLLTVVAIQSLGDDPWVSGASAVLFFVAFGLGMAVIVYVMLDSTLMTVRVAGSALEVSMGVMGRRREWQVEALSGVSATRHGVVRHGGRGNVFAPSSRRAWLMFGVPDGVEFELAADDADGEVTRFFVSSRRGEELVGVLRMRTGSSAGGSELARR